MAAQPARQLRDAAEPGNRRRARRPYRPPIGIPRRPEAKWVGVVASVLFHGLILLALLIPALRAVGIDIIPQGAGGPGPAGGGGGGNRGSGGAPVQERLQYIEVAPPAPVATPTPTPVPTPPVVKPPEVVPPPQPPPQEPTKDEVKTEAPAVAPAPAPTPGTGGGTGNDGTAGTGPGTGGGVGSGIGTGRGSGIGPGTGGGNGENYSPSLLFAFIPPMPIPDKVKGTEVIATFDVDSTGRVLSFKFTETRDRGYNKRLKEVFGEFKFRPAVRPDGTPIRALAQVAYTL